MLAFERAPVGSQSGRFTWHQIDDATQRKGHGNTFGVFVDAILVIAELVVDVVDVCGCGQTEFGDCVRGEVATSIRRHDVGWCALCGFAGSRCDARRCVRVGRRAEDLLIVAGCRGADPEGRGVRVGGGRTHTYCCR